MFQRAEELEANFVVYSDLEQRHEQLASGQRRTPVQLKLKLKNGCRMFEDRILPKFHSFLPKAVLALRYFAIASISSVKISSAGPLACFLQVVLQLHSIKKKYLFVREVARRNSSHKPASRGSMWVIGAVDAPEAVRFETTLTTLAARHILVEHSYPGSNQARAWRFDVEVGRFSPP